MTANIPMSSVDSFPVPMSLRKPKPLRPDQVNHPRNQRKIRKNKRRLVAAGGKVDFKKSNNWNFIR